MDVRINIPRSKILGEHLLSGVEHVTDGVIFTIDGYYCLAKEDPDDGYRSYFEGFQIVNRKPSYSFPPQSVIVTEEDINKGLMIVARCVITKKIVLMFGTDYSEDWYPWCVTRWIPENLAINKNK